MFARIQSSACLDESAVPWSGGPFPLQQYNEDRQSNQSVNNPLPSQLGIAAFQRLLLPWLTPRDQPP